MHDAGRARGVCMTLVGCVGYAMMRVGCIGMHDAGRVRRVCMMLVGCVGYA